ncbi:hypothetical protein N7463_002310 [Penicillium fimorum]|uniref:BTB domain-containing protein n=1 Tax=Penicillium fimorum TaxID=1882269 RepID=A0A9W9XZ68_9EURO|nr:hypothetical protein N7463_002310 [Penicillium fimorum]
MQIVHLHNPLKIPLLVKPLTYLEIHNGLPSTVTLFKFSTFRFELPEQSQPPPEEEAINSKEKEKKRKNERKYGEAQTTLEEYAAEEPAIEESAVEESAAEFGTLNYVRIQVSAKHLMFASSVFRKILTGRWKGSITYLQKGSVEITAESWDTEAFLILLRAIHAQYYYIPRKPTLAILAKVAVIADYYECKTALYIMKDIWIDNLVENIPGFFNFTLGSKDPFRLRYHEVTTGLLALDFRFLQMLLVRAGHF